MNAPLPPPGGSVSRELLATLDALAGAAARGPVGPATVLSHIAAARRAASVLAVAEEALDTLTDEAREVALDQRALSSAHAHALADGLAARRILPFPTRRPPPMAVPFHDHHGGAA